MIIKNLTLGNNLATASNIGRSTNLMKPICAFGFVTFSLLTKLQIMRKVLLIEKKLVNNLLWTFTQTNLKVHFFVDTPIHEGATGKQHSKKQSVQ